MHGHLNKGISAYTHIEKNDNGYITNSQSIIQLEILKKLDSFENSKIISIVGEDGVGKTSLIKKFLKESSSRKIWMNANRINKMNINKIEKIMRSVIVAKIKEQVKIVEGEVLNIKNNMIVLKTIDMESEFNIGVKIQKELEKERVSVGDVIKIYKEAGFLTKIGKSTVNEDEENISLLKKVNIPEGECFKVENIITELTVHEIDIINYKEDGEQYIYKNINVPDLIRAQVDDKINKWKKQDKLVLKKGILVIENADKLNNEIFEKLLKYKNCMNYPMIILIAENDKRFKDNNLLVLNILKPGFDEKKQILKARLDLIYKKVEDDGFEFLMAITEQFGLSRAFYLIQACTEEIITRKVLEKIDKIFLPLKSNL